MSSSGQNSSPHLAVFGLVPLALGTLGLAFPLLKVVKKEVQIEYGSQKFIPGLLRKL